MKIMIALLLTISTATAWADAAGEAKCKALYAQPAIAPLLGKILMRPPATFAQLTDTSRPTEAEQVAIIEYDKARVECSTYVVQDLADAPDMVDAFSAAVRQEQEVRAELYLSKITFGEYNTASQRIMRAVEAKADELDRRDQQAARQGPSGAIARGAAAGARQALPVYNPFPKPLICTSTRRGTLIDTYCR